MKENSDMILHPLKLDVDLSLLRENKPETFLGRGKHIFKTAVISASKLFGSEVSG